MPVLPGMESNFTSPTSYVMAFNENGAKLCSYKIIGKVIDNCYYSMEEYQQKFKRNGEPRLPEPKTPNRSYVRAKPFFEVKRKAPKYAEGLPDAATVKNFPHEVEGARCSLSLRRSEVIKDPLSVR